MDALDDLRSRVNRRKVAVAGAVIVLFLVVAAPIAADTMLTDTYVRVYDTSATVHQQNDSNVSVGVATGEGMAFGSTVVGADMRRFINLTAETTTYITTSTTGNISRHLTTDAGMVFTGREVIQITLNADTAGFYTGKIRLKTQVATSDLGARWLRLKSDLF